MRTFRLFAVLGLVLAALTGLAQAPADIQQSRLEQNHKLVFFGDGNADSTVYNALINRFYVDQFRHSQDPRAPYFMLMSRNGQMAMGVGGDIKMLGAYDWHSAISGMDFCPYSIPMAPSPENRNLFQTSFGSTALFFTVFGTDKRFGQYNLYIEGKFCGPHNTFQLKKAYATVGDWTLGYTKSTFTDPASQPSTVENEGPNSEIDDTRLLLRYMHSPARNFTFALSAETPNDQDISSINYRTGSTYMPNFAAFVQYGTHKQHIRLSGIVKSMRYQNLVESKTSYVTGWGLNLTTVFRPIDPVTIYAAGNTGQGIGSMVNDLSCGVNDLLGVANKPGSMEAPRSFGWYAAVQYNFSPSVFSTLIASQERILPGSHAIYADTDYKYGLYGTANVFWNITPRCQLGAEFNIGKRVDMSGSHRLAYRAGLLAEFSF